MPAKTKYIFVIPLLAAILASVVFSGTLKNGFVQGWDDEMQVVNNQDIQNLDFYKIKKIFSSYYVGMYQPLTTLTYALDYKLSGMNAGAFHRSNLLLHLVNIFLVFYLFLLFSGKIEIATVVTFLFAVHPGNTESVAWISARSNLLYTSFYLASLISYIKYLKEGKAKMFPVMSVFFVLSVLSKATAVTLPVVLLLFDLWFKNKITKGDILRKLPLLVLSFIFIAVAFDARVEFSHLADLSRFFNTGERIVLVLYSAVFYILMFFVPVNLSAIHYYPVEGVGISYYLAAVLFIIIAFLTLRLFFKALKKKQFKNPLLFGILFFALTISVVIHFVQIGIQIVAERYVYLPYLGLYFAAAFYLLRLKNSPRFKKYRHLPAVILFAVVVVFSMESYKQTGVWRDCNTLMSDVIKKNPGAIHAYLVRGDGFMHEGKYKEALNDYAVVISRYPAYESTWINRANVYARTGQFEKAIADLNKAAAINNKRPETYFNRGLAKYNLKDYKGAVEDFGKAIAVDKNYELAYLYRGVTYGMSGDYKSASKDLEKCLELNPENIDALKNLGVLMIKKGEYGKAAGLYGRIIKIEPDNAGAYFTRALALLKSGDKEGACSDFRKAHKFGNKAAAAYLGKYCN